MEAIKSLDRGKTIILNGLNTMACFWIFVLIILIAIDVGGRVFFNVLFKGTPELVSNSLIIITFLEIPYVLHHDQHVRTTIILDRLGPVAREYFEIIAYVLGLVMFALLIVSCWPNLITAIQIGEFEGEGALRVPTSPARAILVLGAFFMIVEYIFKIIFKFQRIGTLKERMIGGTA